MEVTTKLQALYDESNLGPIGDKITQLHAEIVTEHIRSLFGLSTIELFKRIQGYNRFKRIVEIATKHTDTAPLEDCYGFDDRIVDLMSSRLSDADNCMSKFSSPISIRTMIIRMGCKNLGKKSAIEDLASNYDPLYKELTEAFKRHNSRLAENSTSRISGSPCDYLHYIYNFYYEQKMVPHTFPIWRSVLVFTETLEPFIDDIKEKKLTAEQLARITQVTDTSAGWGDRMYHALLWRHCLGKVLIELDYPSEFVSEMMSYKCYIGFDVNLAMKDVYVELATRICNVLDFQNISNTSDIASIAEVHMIDSTSFDAFKIMMLNSYGSFLTSSPTPLEIYSDCDGDSNKRFCQSNNGTDHIRNGKNWVFGFVAGILSNISRVMGSRLEMANNTGDRTYLMRMADSIDSYSATSFENGRMVKTNIPVAEDFLEMLTIYMGNLADQSYDVGVINNCYIDTEKVPIRGCKGCRKANNSSTKIACDRCSNSHAIRSIIVAVPK